MDLTTEELRIILNLIKQDNKELPSVKLELKSKIEDELDNRGPSNKDILEYINQPYITGYIIGRVVSSTKLNKTRIFYLEELKDYQFRTNSDLNFEIGESPNNITIIRVNEEDPHILSYTGFTFLIGDKYVRFKGKIS